MFRWSNNGEPKTKPVDVRTDTSVSVLHTALDTRLQGIEHELQTLKRRVGDLEYEAEALRDKVLRKIQVRKPPEDDQEANAKDIYKGVLIPERV